MTALTPPLPLPARPTPVLTGYYVDGGGNYAPFSDVWLLEDGSVGLGWARSLLAGGSWTACDRREDALCLIPSLLFVTSWQPMVDWENDRLCWNDVDHVILPETTNIALRAFLMEALNARDQAVP